MERNHQDGKGVCLNSHQFLVVDSLSSYEIYDTTSKLWQTVAIDMPQQQSWCPYGVVSAGNRVFAIGGEAPWSHTSIEVYYHERITLPGTFRTMPPLWKRLASMNRPRVAFACVSYLNYIYVFGGYNDGSALNSAVRYNINTNQWQDLPDMPDSRFDCAAGVVGLKIYVVGGRRYKYIKSASKAIGSVLVFDIASYQWESWSADADPAFHHMATKRYDFPLVVKEHFLIAIGGVDDEGKELSTIEIFDTRRNTWKYAQSQLKFGRKNAMAGYLEATNEIIVAGGSTGGEWKDSVDSIDFDEGLLPPGFTFKERVQKVYGDTDQGEDQLGVAVMAQVMAETAIAEDLQPPFVLAILGKWGRGKSFFFNLMLEYMINVQKMEADKFYRKAYAGHVYVVKFDAWTYSKGNLWPSLMYQILKDLNEQLQFEKRLGKTGLNAGAVSTIEVFRDFSTREVRYLQEKFDQNVWKNYRDICKNGDRASELLLRAINTNYEQDQKALKEIDKKIGDELTRIQLERTMNQAKNALQDIGMILGEEALEKIQTDDVECVDDLINNIKNINCRWYYSLRISNVPSYAIICATLFIILAIVVFLVFEDRTVGIVCSVLSPVLPVITSISSAVQEINPIVKRLQELNVNPVGDPELGMCNSDELKILKEEKTEIENRTLVLEGDSLRDAIATKINAKAYENNLGVVHQVQRDLQHISEAMLSTRQTDIFPRGDPRIVLFVDDLDRCEHHELVKVIEALQLLVKTKLFVVVIAVDPRYVCLSLEKHYGGILNSRTPPSGMDFLEKIIQIPYRLPEVEGTAVDDFVDSQIDVEYPSKDVKKSPPSPDKTCDEVSDNRPEKAAEKPSETNIRNDQLWLRESVGADRDVSQNVSSVVTGSSLVKSFSSDDDRLPITKVSFSPEEAREIKTIFKLFTVGPRCMKLNLNVFKMLQVIWKREAARTGATFDLRFKRATFFLMLLASHESTREVTYTIFEWMEAGMVRYHRVKDHNNLASLFKAAMQKWDENYALLSNGESNKPGHYQGTLLAYLEDYLKDYGWSNVDEWNTISSKFLLARCYSFFRLSPEETDTNIAF